MFRFWLRVGVFLLIVGATVGIVLIETERWQTAPNWAPAVLGVLLGAFAGYEYLFGAHRARRALLERRVRDAQVAALFEINEISKIPHSKLGLCCYVVPRWFTMLLPRGARSVMTRRLPKWLRDRLPSSPALQRVDRLRPRSLTQTAIEWRHGVGVIGLCWKSRKDVVVDFMADYADYMNCDRQTWDALSDEERLGLTFNQFDRIRGKYGLVIASPILDGDEFIGCITLDTPYDNDRPYFDKLWKREVRVILGNTATYVKNFYGKVDG